MINGNRICWEDNRNGNFDIYLYDIQTGEETQITTDLSDQRSPVINDNQICWEDYRNGNADIYLYDIHSEQEFRITTHFSNQSNPRISGNRIVWQDGRDGKEHIYMAELMINPPVISLLTPSSGYITTKVTISGENFGASQDAISKVTFNGIETKDYISWSDSQIQVKVPIGAATGPVVIETPAGRSNANCVFTVWQAVGQYRISDINRDGVVNWNDFSILASQYGRTGCTIDPQYIRADINGDNTVNIADWGLLTKDFNRQATLICDITLDYTVNIYDLSKVSTKLGTSVYDFPELDINRDTNIDHDDLEIIKVDFNKTIANITRYLLDTDLNRDGFVDANDRKNVQVGLVPWADVNGDGQVNILDITLIERDLPFITGDVNFDGDITQNDVQLVTQYCAGLTELTLLQKQAADVNKDGKIDIEDAMLITEYVAGQRDAFPPGPKNLKDTTTYSNREAFLISDKKWQDVLSLVSVTTWTEEDGTIMKYPTLIWHNDVSPSYDMNLLRLEFVEVVEGAEAPLSSFVIGVFPFDPRINVGEIKSLDVNIAYMGTVSKHVGQIKVKNYQPLRLVDGDAIFLNNTFEPYDSKTITLRFTLDEPIVSFDADSIIYFFQQYSPDKLTIIGDTPAELDNLLIAAPSYGAGLSSSQIQRIPAADYFSCWNNIKTMVYAEDDYELSLVASTYASLKNAPLIVQGSSLDTEDIFKDRDVILVGNVSCPADANCIETYTRLEDLQNQYYAASNAQDFILVNPTDLTNGIAGNLTPDKPINADPVFNLHLKTSLAAPFLASAKHELILSTTHTTYEDIDNFLEARLDDFLHFDSLPSYICNFDDVFARGFNDTTFTFSTVTTNTATFIFTPVSLGENMEVHFTLGGLHFNCSSEVVEIYINDETMPITTINIPSPTREMILDPEQHRHASPTVSLGEIPAKVTVKFDGDFVWSEVFPLDIGPLPFPEFFRRGTFGRITDPGGPTNLVTKSFSDLVATGESFFTFNNVDLNYDYDLETRIVSKISTELPIYVGTQKVGETIRDSTATQFSGWKKQKLFRKAITNDLTFRIGPPDYSTFYKIEARLAPNFLNSLTIMAGPQVIPISEFTGFLFQYEVYRSLDFARYADVLYDDYLADLGVGRITGLTLSDVSSYVARSLFHDTLTSTNNMKFMASWLDDDYSLNVMATQAMSERFYDTGYNAVASTSTEVAHTFSPAEWESQDSIYYSDHGTSNWAGIYSSDIPLLPNSLVFADACLTCSDYGASSFCMNALRQGAIGYLGAVSVTASCLITQRNTLSEIYFDEVNIGQAFKKGYYFAQSNHNIFLGDPTLILDPLYLLLEPLAGLPSSEPR
ncbi:MAG: dockerin type I domain-containing protein [Candidatus Omnitrophota bacterium]